MSSAGAVKGSWLTGSLHLLLLPASWHANVHTAELLNLSTSPHAGKLMGQLHDRNCRRAFAPAEAFQADQLPADRFQSEVQVGRHGHAWLLWCWSIQPGDAADWTARRGCKAQHPCLYTLQAATAAGRGLDEEGAGRAWGLLAHAPYLVPFRERAKLFQAVVAQVSGLGWAIAALSVGQRCAGCCYPGSHASQLLACVQGPQPDRNRN